MNEVVWDVWCQRCQKWIRRAEWEKHEHNPDTPIEEVRNGKRSKHDDSVQR